MKLSPLSLGALLTAGCVSDVATIREGLVHAVTLQPSDHEPMRAEEYEKQDISMDEQRGAQRRPSLPRLQRLLVSFPHAFGDTGILRFYITAGCGEWHVSATRVVPADERAINFIALQAANVIRITSPQPGSTRFCFTVPANQVVAAYRWRNINHPSEAYNCRTSDGISCQQTGNTLNVCVEARFIPYVLEPDSNIHFCY